MAPEELGEFLEEGVDMEEKGEKKAETGFPAVLHTAGMSP